MAEIRIYKLTDESGPTYNVPGHETPPDQPQSGTVRGSTPFRPQARLIRMLGEELISDEVMALLEMVKNAYDADARRVVIRLQHTDNSDSIEILDDGDGMDLETILRAWLEPATRQKRGGRWKRRTALGRFPLGEKGVGRFAADKLGADLVLITRARGAPNEVVLRVSWGLFEADGYLDEVESHWEVRPPEHFEGASHGTLIRIGNLRASWNAALLERVHDGLARLISPNTDANDFAIILDCTSFPEFSGQVTNRVLNRAAYRLQGQVDSEGLLHFNDATGTHSIVDLRAKMPDQFWGENGLLRLPLCGPFGIALHAWDLDLMGLRRAGMDRTMRQILKQWSGVSIYRDRFRVLPYGEKDDDWLELNQRRVNNPTLRLSNNQIIGIIEITQHDNPDLRDRTSREGMIDTAAFTDLKQLVLGALSYLEETRFVARRPVQELEEPVALEEDPVLRLVRQVESHDGGTGIRAVLTEIERTYRATIADFQSREENLLRLAGLGVAAERMTQDIAATITSATVLVDILRNRAGTLHDPGQSFQEPLRQIGRLLISLENQLDILTPLSASSPDGHEHVDLRSVVQDAAQVFGQRFRQAGIVVTVTENAAPSVYAQYGHIMQAVLALFDNAVYWLRSVPSDTKRQIRVHLWASRKRGGLILADNGPGISPRIAKLIFEPSYSTRRDGLGLGLFIVRTLVQRYEGTVELLEKDRLLPGANLRLQFPLTGSDL